MDAFVNVIRKDPQVRISINDALERYLRLTYKYESKIGNDCLIQKNILDELIKILGTIITELDIELKMESSRIKFLENKKLIEFCSIINILTGLQCDTLISLESK